MQQHTLTMRLASEIYLHQWKSLFREPFLIALGTGFLLIHAAFLAAHHVAPDSFVSITKEDGVLEYGSALLYLLASLLCAHLTMHRTRGLARLWAITFAFGFFFMAGEEISWAQRIFSYRVESIERINIQTEFNLHNLVPGIWNARLLSIGSLSFGVLLPVALGVSRPFRMFLLDRLSFPAPHPIVAVCFVLSYLWYSTYHPGSPIPLAVEESRETSMALGFFVFTGLFTLNLYRLPLLTGSTTASSVSHRRGPSTIEHLSSVT